MRRLLAALALAALAVGCGDTTSPNSSPVGTYRLESFNGSAMPAVYFQSTDETVYITGSTLNINADGTFAEVISYRDVTSTQDINDTSVDGGTWDQVGSTITFNSSQNSSYTGQYQGSTITETGQDTWVYRRQ